MTDFYYIDIQRITLYNANLYNLLLIIKYSIEIL